MREKVKPLSEESIVTQIYAIAWIFELWSNGKLQKYRDSRVYKRLCLSRKTQCIVEYDRMMNGEFVK